VRRAVEFLVTRVIRSRLGVALVIAVLILGVVGAGRLFSDSVGSGTGRGAGPVRPIATVDPTVGDDGAIFTQPPASPVTSPGAPIPEKVAESFVTAWLGGRGDTAEAWQARLRPYSTPELTEKLDGADPAGVPAKRVVGTPSLRPRTEAFVEVLVPLDAGQLRLELIAHRGRWLVDAVDWERE
jgi:hypothetical protein